MKIWVKDPQGKYHRLPPTLDGDVLIRFPDGQVGFDYSKYAHISFLNQTNPLFQEWVDSYTCKVWDRNRHYFGYDEKNHRGLLIWDRLHDEPE